MSEDEMPIPPRKEEDTTEEKEETVASNETTEETVVPPESEPAPQAPFSPPPEEPREVTDEPPPEIEEDVETAVAEPQPPITTIEQPEPTPTPPPAKRRAPKPVAVLIPLVLCLLLWGLFSIPLGPLPALGNLLSPIGGLWTVAQRVGFTAQEQINLPAMSANATVEIDDLGVPHIFAESDEDAAMVLGYLHARQRLAQMDLQRRVASGRLAALVGTDGLEEDRFMRTVGLHRAAAASLANMEPDEPALKMLEAYSAGVNAYIAEVEPHHLPLEYKLLGVRNVEPWTPLDSLTFAKFMAWDLSHSWDDLFMADLQDALGPEIVANLYPIDRPYDVLMVDQWPPEEAEEQETEEEDSAPPEEGDEAHFAPRTALSLARQDILAQAAAAGQLHAPTFELGSNNWAVGGTKTAAGTTILSSDPHLGYQLPSLWYQAHMVTPEMNVSGVTLVGVPFVVIGHTERIAWGLTNTQADVVDYFVERTNPENENEIWFEGAWRPVETVEEVIPVRGGRDETEMITVTSHGPVLTRRGRTVSMRWTGLDPSFELRAFYKLNHAQNYEAFLDGLRDFHVPAQNFAYADAGGNIAIWSAGKYPIRATGNGRVPVPAATGTYEWTGFIPFEELPHIFNPAEGYVFSANTRPVPPEYPYYLGWQWDPGYRGRRIEAILGENGTVDMTDMQTAQYDTVDTLAMEMVPILLEVYDELQFGGQAEAQAIALLEAWDYRMSADASAPMVWRHWIQTFREMTWKDEFEASGAPMDHTWGFSGTNSWQPTLEYFEQLVREEPQSSWFDNVTTTAVVETRDDIIAESFSQAVLRLQESYGGNPDQWRWGAHHHLHLEHLLDAAPLNRGGQEMAGGNGTINAQGWDEQVGGGPSWRMIVQFDPLQAVGAYPGGQSGHPLSPHYDDLIEAWRSGDLPPMHFPETPGTMPAEVLETTLTFSPGGTP